MGSLPHDRAHITCWLGSGCSASVVVHLKAGPQLNCSFRGGELYQDDVRDGAGVVGRERQVKVIPQDIEALLECFL